MTPPQGQLRILLLGGFEAWSGGQQLRGFESQKVRALLAYLALHRGKPLSRDHLAGMFWGEKDGDSARRNLRQAIYNLKATLPGEDSARPHLLVDAHELRFSADSDAWVDVEAFEHAAGPASDAGNPGVHDFASAAQLYRGELLAGLMLRDCVEFEEWLLAAQERLRDAALDALRTLVAGYLSRGEYRLGIRQARRLVAMDPLSEEAHRNLLRLYELAGHRGQALAHYAELRELLRRELGVEPLAETQALYENILADALRVEGAIEKPDALGPIVPMVGRAAQVSQLAECWQSVLDGGFQTTLLIGEEGIGKTRLARSFLDATTAHRRLTVLTGACIDQSPQPSGGPLAEALRQALLDEVDGSLSQLAELPPDSRRHLAVLFPDLANGEPAPAPDTSPAGREALAEAVAELLDQLTRAAAVETANEPVVLFLDDLQWADALTLAVLEALPRWLPGSRVWILGAFDPKTLARHHPLLRLAARDGDGVVTTIELERLGSDALVQLASTVADPHDATAVASLLAGASEGLPLAIVTLLNSMWDEGDLVVETEGRWRLRGAMARWQTRAADGLDDAILRRVRRLPTSTRRLATMASVIGQRFDSELLRLAEDEHADVVETGLGLLLERWLVRQHRERWNARGLESSVALWSRGARHGPFQFDHPRLRAALYGDLHPLRKQVLHRQVADALARRHADRLADFAEDLAHHYLQAGVWDRAYEYLQLAASRALAARDPESARQSWTQARRVVERLRQQASDERERQRWRMEEGQLEARLASLSA